MGRLVSLLVILWLVVGAVAAWQRGYFSSGGDTDCAGATTILVTVAAGPLNYVGVNPKADCPELPQPSQ